MKLRSSKGIAIHVFIHLLVTALLIREPLSHLPLLTILGASHFLFDWLKLRYPSKRQVPGFLVDQALHLIALVILAAVSTTVEPVLPIWPLTLAIFYALIPPIIMFLWLLAIDEGQVMKRTNGCIYWAQRNLLPISQHAGLPLLVGVGLGILLL